ncbi:hypothetical protein [Phaeobacter sp. B1627]|uniref:hypothetical protein n=1 Tax=Phaeobacter sp. B1627 TaxID=2583809 RepID=UPI0011192350|nr:hypothetical protein [Phaeobacter sp. B1627]TNJ39444.1 hypothetical protein FGE21_18930 [Phaeobacter sp. B1627]
MCPPFPLLIETQNPVNAAGFQASMYQNVALFEAEDSNICRALAHATLLVDASALVPGASACATDTMLSAIVGVIRVQPDLT